MEIKKGNEFFIYWNSVSIDYIKIIKIEEVKDKIFYLDEECNYWEENDLFKTLEDIKPIALKRIKEDYEQQKNIILNYKEEDFQKGE